MEKINTARYYSIAAIPSAKESSNTVHPDWPKYSSSKLSALFDGLMSARSRRSFSGESGIFLCGRRFRKTATTSVQLKGAANAKMRSFCIAGANKAIACSRAVSCTSTYHSSETVLALLAFKHTGQLTRRHLHGSIISLRKLPYPTHAGPWNLRSKNSSKLLLLSISIFRKVRSRRVFTSQFGRTELKMKPGWFSLTHFQAARSPSVLDAA